MTSNTQTSPTQQEADGRTVLLEGWCREVLSRTVPGYGKWVTVGTMDMVKGTYRAHRMSKGRKKASLRDLTSKIPEPDDHDAIVSELTHGSDRACALIAVSFLDRALLALLSTQMHGVHISEHTPIFYGQGAVLGSFSSKIRMCYVLALISKEQSKHLNKMRGIRNHFAHALGLVSFADAIVATECETLWQDTAPIPSKLHHLSKPRMKFMARWSLLSRELPQRYLDLLKASPHVPADAAASIAEFVLSEPQPKDSK